MRTIDHSLILNSIASMHVSGDTLTRYATSQSAQPVRQGAAAARASSVASAASMIDARRHVDDELGVSRHTAQARRAATERTMAVKRCSDSKVLASAERLWRASNLADCRLRQEGSSAFWQAPVPARRAPRPSGAFTAPRGRWRTRRRPHSRLALRRQPATSSTRSGTARRLVGLQDHHAREMEPRQASTPCAPARRDCP